MSATLKTTESTPRAQEILDRLEHFGVKLGLERMRVLLAALDDPHLAVPVVLVAGTNGKGSTASLLASMAQAAGYRTGLFISPHLEVMNERISIDGRAISDRQLAHQLHIAVSCAEELQAEPPTYFEAFTLSAFGHFRDKKVDLAIFEVGLGGRLDATNSSEPILSLITSIDLDHQRLLGSTRAAVAGEKCGILRRDRPAFAWGQEEEVEAVFKERAAAVGARLTLAENAVRIEPRGEADAIPQKAVIHSASGVNYPLELALLGEHQLRNLALAVLAAEKLQTMGFERLDRKAIIEGTAQCRWAGRLEWVPLPDGRRVLLDAAHNAAGAAALARYLDHQKEQPTLLFGVLGDKKIPDMLPPLAKRSRRVVLTRPPGKRGVEPEDLASFVGDRPTILEADPERALELALEGSEVVLACGSLYLVGEIRPLLRKHFGVPKPVFLIDSSTASET